MKEEGSKKIKKSLIIGIIIVFILTCIGLQIAAVLINKSVIENESENINLYQELYSNFNNRKTIEITHKNLPAKDKYLTINDNESPDKIKIRNDFEEYENKIGNIYVKDNNNMSFSNLTNISLLNLFKNSDEYPEEISKNNINFLDSKYYNFKNDIKINKIKTEIELYDYIYKCASKKITYYTNPWKMRKILNCRNDISTYNLSDIESDIYEIKGDYEGIIRHYSSKNNYHHYYITLIQNGSRYSIDYHGDFTFEYIIDLTSTIIIEKG